MIEKKNLAGNQRNVTMAAYGKSIGGIYPDGAQTTARNDGILSPLGKYFVLGVLEMYFPLYLQGSVDRRQLLKGTNLFEGIFGLVLEARM